MTTATETTACPDWHSRWYLLHERPNEPVPAACGCQTCPADEPGEEPA